MTQILPNTRAAAEQTTIELSPKKLVHAHLAHAQVMIGMGIFQLAILVQRSGGDVVGEIDYDKFPNAYELSGIAIYSSGFVMLAIFALVGWIVVSSKSSELPMGFRQANSPFAKTVSGQTRQWPFLLVLGGVPFAAFGGLLWLKLQDVIPRSLYSAGMTIVSILFSIACFVYAVVQIRNALKLIGEGSDL